MFVSLVVFAATCMCVCTDSLSAPIAPSHKAHSCCDVDHGKADSRQAPVSHDDCRICGLKIWSGARITTATNVDLRHVAMPIATPSVATIVFADFSTRSIQASDPPAPPNTLLSLHCQLLC